MSPRQSPLPEYRTPTLHRSRRRHLPALATALSLLGSPRSAAAQTPTTEPAPAAPATIAPSAVDPGKPGPIVHFTVRNADPDKGPVKLARYRGPTQAAVTAGNAVVVMPYFDVLCTEPCDTAIDVSERPMFYFIRDGHPVSHAFRLSNLDGHVTLEVKTLRRSLALAGAYTLTLVVGIPMLIAAVPRVWIAKGQPGPGLRFKRLKRARL